MADLGNAPDYIHATQALTGISNETVAIGQREDLSNIINRIDPDDVPFYSNARKGGCSATLTEWQVQELSAVQTTAQNEGFEATVIEAATPTVRHGNRTQIIARSGAVTGTLDAVDKAGRDRELAYQKILKGIELRRDLDTILTRDQAASGTDPRTLGSIASWISNSVGGITTFVAATGDGSDVHTAGVARNIVDSGVGLAEIDSVMLLCYNDGGSPRTMYSSPARKVDFSNIDVGTWGESIQNQFNMSSVREGAYIGSVSLYLTDFGRLEVIVDRFMPTERFYLIDPSYCEVCTLPGRGFHTVSLAKSGDNEKFYVAWEGTLTVGAPKAHGAVHDIGAAPA